MARLMRAVPEMMVIIKGMVASTRTVVITGALMTLVLYTFCILFTDAYHERERAEDVEEPEIEAMFGTMGKSMFSLFIYATILDDVTQATNAIRASENWWMLTAFMFVILISSFMMLNMLIGVLVEVVGATAEGEREKAIESNIREAIGHIFSNMDQDSNKEISRGEFLAMRKHKAVMDALGELDIHSAHFNLYAELLFRPSEEQESGGVVPGISYEKLVSMILRLRPGSFVSALDFAAFAKTIPGIHDRIKGRVMKVESICMELAWETNGDDPQLLASDNSLGALAPPPLGHQAEVHSHLSIPGVPALSLDKPKAPGPTQVDVVSPFSDKPGGLPPLGALSALSGLNEADRDRLERTASTDIIEELQRRLGMADLDKTGVPYSMMDEELQTRVRAAAERGAEAAFMTLGVPQPDGADETVYV